MSFASKSSSGRRRFSPACFITSDIMLVLYLMKEKVGGKEGERTFSSRRAKIRESRSRQRANESLQTDETVPRTNRTRTDRERERNNKCVPCANRRLKSTSHRWVYLRRKSKPSFQTSRRRIQIRFRGRKEDEFSSSPLFLK